MPRTSDDVNDPVPHPVVSRPDRRSSLGVCDGKAEKGAVLEELVLVHHHDAPPESDKGR